MYRQVPSASYLFHWMRLLQVAKAGEMGGVACTLFENKTEVPATQSLHPRQDTTFRFKKNFNFCSRLNKRTMMGLGPPVLFYGVKNPNGHFSNFAFYPIFIDGRKYTCNEQYIMYSKALLFGDKDAMDKIMRTSNPAIMKSTGREVKGFDKKQWSAIIPTIADTCNMAKFSQHPELKMKLLATGNTLIADASPSDRVWGIGVDAERGKDVRTWRGENLLGKSLMRVRKRLQESETTSTQVALIHG
jgi:ribA/ribD-fused uncharacterized protein